MSLNQDSGGYNVRHSVAPYYDFRSKAQGCTFHSDSTHLSPTGYSLSVPQNVLLPVTAFVFVTIQNPTLDIRISALNSAFSSHTGLKMLM